MGASQRDLDRAQRAGELLELAALTSGGLRTAFEDVAALLDGEMFHLFNFTRPEAPDMIVSDDRAAIYADYLANGWHEQDIWSHTAAKIARHGRVLTDGILTHEIRRRAPFYQEFCTKWGIGNFTAWTFDLAGERWSYTLMGRAGQGAAPIDGDIYKRFIEAADRAALLATATEKVRAFGIAQGLELGGRPTIVLDHNGRVSFLTQTAEMLLGQGFRIRHDRLEGEHPDTDLAFRQLAREASSSRRSMLRNFLIQRDDGRKPIVVMPVHVRDRGLHGLPGTRIILIMTDLELPLKEQAISLQELFALTRREAELAALLANSVTLIEAARRMRIEFNTARQMLKSVFAKVGVHRQAELVGLLTRLAG